MIINNPTELTAAAPIKIRQYKNDIMHKHRVRHVCNSSWLDSTRRQFKYLYTLLEVRSLSGRRRSQRTYHFDESMIFKDQTYFHLPQRTRSWRCCRRIGRHSADPKQVPHERQHFQGLNDYILVWQFITETLGTSRWQTEPPAMRKKNRLEIKSLILSTDSCHYGTTVHRNRSQ